MIIPEPRAYFTSSDVRVRMIDHPDPNFRGKDLDAAYFALSAGETPIHIWNYTYRPHQELGEGDSLRLFGLADDSIRGGSLFDDTALGVHTVHLQIIMNAARFQDYKYQFLPHSRIGDVAIVYRALDSWGQGERSETGYYLSEGHVGQVGEEITLQGAVHPTITLIFREARRLRKGLIPVFRSPDTPTAVELIELPAEEDRLVEISFRDLHADIEHEDSIYRYHPRRVPQHGFPQGEAFLRPALTPMQLVRTQASSIEEWIDRTSFTSAFKEVKRDHERELYAWQVGLDKYRLIHTSTSRDQSTLVDNTLPEELQELAATLLFGYKAP